MSRHDELHPSEMERTARVRGALAEAQRLGYDEADRPRSVNGADAAAKMAILARLAFDRRCTRQGALRGLRDIRPRPRVRREFGLGLKLIGSTEKHRRGDQRARAPDFMYHGISADQRRGPFKLLRSSSGLHEITISGREGGRDETPARC